MHLYPVHCDFPPSMSLYHRWAVQAAYGQGLICTRTHLYLAVDRGCFWNDHLSHDPSNLPSKLDFSHLHYILALKSLLFKQKQSQQTCLPTSPATDSYVYFILQQKSVKELSILNDFTYSHTYENEVFIWGNVCVLLFSIFFKNKTFLPPSRNNLIQEVIVANQKRVKDKDIVTERNGNMSILLGKVWQSLSVQHVR